MAGAALWPLRRRAAAQPAPTDQTLYNGITLGSPWPPRLKYADEHPVVPPYLADPPAVIPIDVGRQLFVDDFLVSDTNMTRTFHRASYHEANPVLRPEAEWERRDEAAERTRAPVNPAAMVFSDGVFFDPDRRRFLMWYMAGYNTATALATSTDGIHWVRPSFDVVPGTNIVDTRFRDSSTIWRDPFEPDRRRRYKMSFWHDHALVLSVSPDGIHWTAIGETAPCGDRSTIFYNPFRRVWVFSLRTIQDRASSISGRYRLYQESRDFSATNPWQPAPVAWVKADSHDEARPGLADRPELYNLDAVAYESVLLGLFSVWRGESTSREKINEVTLGFSRDGFHWHRPDRQAFLPVSDTEGSWNWANVQSAGGGCLIVGDLLYFYVSGRRGVPGTSLPGVCSTGLATLRRDGFASMDWLPGQMPVMRLDEGGRRSGSLTTRPVQFSGGHLFVNADARGGELRVEVLNREGTVIPPFTYDACVPIASDGVRLPVRWAAPSLAPLAGRGVRFRFSLTRGRLYAFWVSPSPAGESRGFVAAGGPAYSGPTDGPSTLAPLSAAGESFS